MQVIVDQYNFMTLAKMELPHGFRKLKPAKWWGSVLEVAISKRELEDAVKKASIKENITYNGYLTHQKNDLLHYYFSQYPRRKFESISVASRLEKALVTLTRLSGGKSYIETRSKEPIFRVVLGLRQGYKKENSLHTVSEIANELDQVGSKVSISEAQILTIGPWGKYTEPAAVIEGNLQHLDNVYLLEEKFRQSRFVVNDLHREICYLVETKWCDNPDRE
ncbi:MAG: hypothetical protein UW73_C0001G0070 [Microgenomates group bacterium GW2011_GWB1_44_8]|nr:MAG: hypothetical protein UW73_C0001G0070 [Microgenomates group bacterium GW2011_GWB1_44_8]